MLWSEHSPMLAALVTKASSNLLGLTRKLNLKYRPAPWRKPADQNGQVHLIGAGPGAVDLLTVRAHRLIQEAEVAIYDRLVSDDILDLLPANCERYYVGKAPGNHSVPQARIGELMVEHSQRGKSIVRIKGGDPAIFARMAEELDALNRAGIQWQIVPGITAASGCAAAAGIPLTDRAVSHQVRFITATHYTDSLSHDWTSLAVPDQTLVFYMGLDALPTISSALQDHGLPGHWPILLIENGTRPNQRNLLSTLAAVTADCRTSAFRTPSLIIVGEIVKSAIQTEQLVASALSAA